MLEYGGGPGSYTPIRTNFTANLLRVIMHCNYDACLLRPCDLWAPSAHVLISLHQALSPLFTVAAYALFFRVRYSPKTYISLFPLTIGVMLACSREMMSLSNAVGLLCAFGSALVFVSSNIFFKKIMPSGSNASASSHKLDKLNLLFYSSSMAFVLMIPIWLYYDLPALLAWVPSVSPFSSRVSPLSVELHPSSLPALLPPPSTPVSTNANTRCCTVGR